MANPGPLAQLVEQGTLNPKVEGSSPSRPMTPTPTQQIACVDGLLGAAEEARIPATDEGLLRGDGVFEVLRVYGGRAFALDDHLRRLGRSAEGMRLPADLAAVRADAERVLEAAGEVDCALRIVLTRGGRRVLLTETVDLDHPPTRLAPVEYAPPRILDGIKSLSYGG